MTREIPVACVLTDKQLQQRRKDYLDKIAASLIDFKELESGFSYRFPLRETICRIWQKLSIWKDNAVLF